MVELAVIDDNITFLQEFKELLGRSKLLQRAEYKIHLYSNPGDYLEFLRSRDPGREHIAFIDMYLQEGSGASLASVLIKEFPQIKTIFISAYPSTAMDIFEAEPIYFLIKPVPEDKLTAALEKAISIIKREKTETATFHIKGEVRTIHLRDIRYVETANRHLIVHTINDSFIIRESMRDCTEKLSENFVLCHRGYLVNMAYIKSIVGLEMQLNSGEKITVSKRRLSETKDRYFGFLVNS